MLNELLTNEGRDVLPSPEHCEWFFACAVMSYFDHHGEGIVVKEEAARKLARAMAARALENDE
jgi:hypothetical protein